MGNIIVLIIISTIVVGAISKIVIEKRKGANCVGCPYSHTDDEGSCSCDGLE